MSGLKQDAQVSFEAVLGSGEGDGGITNGQLLSRLAEAMWEGEPLALAEVRAQIGVDDFVSRRQTTSS